MLCKKANHGRKHHSLHKRVIVTLTPTTELLGWIAQLTYMLHVVRKTKTGKILADTVSCPIKATPSKNSNKPVNPPEDIGIMALAAVMELVIENLSSKGQQTPLWSHLSNKVRVLLDTGSTGDLFL